MLKVLHIYPKNDSTRARYVSMLTEAMKGMIDSAFTDDKSDFQRLCADFQPDIVHVHGEATVRTDIRRVLSPDGTPLPDGPYYAVIARSQIEARRLNAPRTEIIRNPLITKTTTFEETARRMHAVYQKVMDSNPLPLLSTAVRRFMGVLLKAGLLGDRRWVERSDGDTVLPRQASADAATLSPTDFRLLYIYCELEGVLPLLQEGIRILQLSVPARQQTVSYLPAGYSVPQSMSGRSIAELLCDLRDNGPTLCRLTDIFAALHDPQLNEEELLAQLQQSELKPLFASTLQLLRETLLLDEGFMPCQPADNRFTQQLRNLLTKHLSL